jgi:hypothetical protein
MYLIFAEAVGLLAGFLIGFYGKRVEISDYYPRKKLAYLAMMGFIVLAFPLGFTLYAWIGGSIPPDIFKQRILGYVLMLLPGLGIGMFANWLSQKLV